MINDKSAKIISNVILDTLKECKTPEERAVLAKLNSNFVKQWDLGLIKLETVNEITNCFDRERAGE